MHGDIHSIFNGFPVLSVSVWIDSLPRFPFRHPCAPGNLGASVLLVVARVDPGFPSQVFASVFPRFVVPGLSPGEERLSVCDSCEMCLRGLDAFRFKVILENLNCFRVPGVFISIDAESAVEFQGLPPNAPYKLIKI